MPFSDGETPARRGGDALRATSVRNEYARALPGVAERDAGPGELALVRLAQVRGDLGDEAGAARLRGEFARRAPRGHPLPFLLAERAEATRLGEVASADLLRDGGVARRAVTHEDPPAYPRPRGDA